MTLVVVVADVFIFRLRQRVVVVVARLWVFAISYMPVTEGRADGFGQPPDRLKQMQIGVGRVPPPLQRSKVGLLNVRQQSRPRRRKEGASIKRPQRADDAA
jgi:hypothetical protein